MVIRVRVVASTDKPSYALRHLKDSSMHKAIDAVQAGEADCCVSAGNTGALMALAMFGPVPYSHLRAHETPAHPVCRLLLEKKSLYSLLSLLSSNSIPHTPLISL